MSNEHINRQMFRRQLGGLIQGCEKEKRPALSFQGFTLRGHDTHPGGTHREGLVAALLVVAKKIGNSLYGRCVEWINKMEIHSYGEIRQHS